MAGIVSGLLKVYRNAGVEEIWAAFVLSPLILPPPRNLLFPCERRQPTDIRRIGPCVAMVGAENVEPTDGYVPILLVPFQHQAGLFQTKEIKWNRTQIPSTKAT